MGRIGQLSTLRLIFGHSRRNKCRVFATHHRSFRIYDVLDLASSHLCTLGTCVCVREREHNSMGGCNTSAPLNDIIDHWSIHIIDHWSILSMQSNTSWEYKWIMNFKELYCKTYSHGVSQQQTSMPLSKSFLGFSHPFFLGPDLGLLAGGHWRRLSTCSRSANAQHMARARFCSTIGQRLVTCSGVSRTVIPYT